jgi:hypothetical protein
VSYSEFDIIDDPSAWINQMTAADIANLGQSLRQINPAWTHPSNLTTGERIWYQGQEPYFDIVLEIQGDTISWVQFTLRGQVLSWQAKTNRITTGETEELDIPPPVAFHAASRWIRSGDRFNVDFVKLAITILKTHPSDTHLARTAALLSQSLPG